MTENYGAFGSYLDSVIKDAGLSYREAASLAGVSDATVRAYVRGFVERKGTPIANPPTVRTVLKLAAVPGFDPVEGLRHAGLPVPKRLPLMRKAQALSLEDLLDEIRARAESAQMTAPLRPQQLTDEQIKARGRSIVRLNGLASEAREVGDDSAADALCELVDALSAQLDAAMAEEISDARSSRRPPIDK